MIFKITIFYRLKVSVRSAHIYEVQFGTGYLFSYKGFYTSITINGEASTIIGSSTGDLKVSSTC